MNLAKLILLLLMVCGSGQKVLAVTPYFLQIGETYTVVLADSGKVDVRVIEIDTHAGWVKVEYKDNTQVHTVWLNLANVGLIVVPPVNKK